MSRTGWVLRPWVNAADGAAVNRGEGHFEHVSHLMEPVVATGSVSGELLGDLSPELRAKMAGSEVRLFVPFQSK